MNGDWQTITALAIVAVAAGLLVRSAWKKRKSPGAGCDCVHAGPKLRVPPHLRRRPR